VRHESCRHMVRRYEKERQRNLLALPGPHPLVIVLDRLKAGYNVAKIFRSAQAFGVRAVHLVGIGPFDPAPAKGAFRKVPARFHEDLTSCLEELLAAGYTLIALSPDGGEALPEAELPERSAFIFGHEEFGVRLDPGTFPALRTLRIPQCGALQSLNVSVAASIVMYEYLRRGGAR
jgi:tRNA G18 (ribose-2'-O)-methylase SpoU